MDPRNPDQADPSLLRAVVDLARWAPSGDNTQPWRFALQPPHRLLVHGHDTRADCVYDLEGEASQLSLGALLCNLDLAASCHGMAMQWQRRQGVPAERPVFDVQFTPAGRTPDPLAACIRQRSVQRRAMHLRPLDPSQMARMEAAAGPGHQIVWLSSWAQRRAAARLLFANAGLRLTLPEAFQTHQRIIAWNSQESEDRIPDQALGASWLTRKLMRFGLKSWQRVDFFNRYLAGTWMPRIELDLVPSLSCAAHYVLLAEREPQGIDDFIAAGQAVQRVWLTSTAEGLWQQPEMTPLIFARYARRRTNFTKDARLASRAANLADGLQALIGDNAARAVWMGRLGHGPAPVARSTRLPLSALILNPEDAPRAASPPEVA
jgi:sulfur-carrier protein adenylyltransferase/sulfurtransferase